MAFTQISFEGDSLLFASFVEESEWPEGTLSPLSPLFLVPESPSCSAGDCRDAPLVDVAHEYSFYSCDIAKKPDWLLPTPPDEVFEDAHGCRNGPRWGTGSMAQAESLLLHVNPPELDPSTYFDFALFDTDMSMSPLQEIAFLPQLDAAPSPEPASDRAPLSLSPPFNNTDAEGDTETDSDATDVESPPSPYIDARRKRRYLPYDVFSPSRTSRCHSSDSFPASTSTRSCARRRREPPNRNIRATLTTAQIETAIRSRAFICPAEKCTFVQKKRRMQDFVRHMESHNTKKWVCCGVPIAKARIYGITDISDAYEYEGESLVGGCRHKFSRADAYKRHLDNKKSICVGSVEFARNFVEKSNS